MAGHGWSGNKAGARAFTARGGTARRTRRPRRGAQSSRSAVSAEPHGSAVSVGGDIRVSMGSILSLHHSANISLTHQNPSDRRGRLGRVVTRADGSGPGPGRAAAPAVVVTTSWEGGKKPPARFSPHGPVRAETVRRSPTGGRGAGQRGLGWSDSKDPAGRRAGRHDPVAGWDECAVGS